MNLLKIGLLSVLLTGLSGVPGAHAENNGLERTPVLGWSSWSFLREHPTAAKIEAQARALKTSGLHKLGYEYVNVDDFWYECPGKQGPNVDRFGRWVIDAARFPAHGRTNGIKAVAELVHSWGMKFGIYVTPGISMQAVRRNTEIQGTSYTADDIANPAVKEHNYNCGGMVAIDYSKPGAQQFIDSWADMFARTIMVVHRPPLTIERLHIRRHGRPPRRGGRPITPKNVSFSTDAQQCNSMRRHLRTYGVADHLPFFRPHIHHGIATRTRRETHSRNRYGNSFRPDTSIEQTHDDIPVSLDLHEDLPVTVINNSLRCNPVLVDSQHIAVLQIIQITWIEMSEINAENERSRTKGPQTQLNPSLRRSQPILTTISHFYRVIVIESTVTRIGPPLRH